MRSIHKMPFLRSCTLTLLLVFAGTSSAASVTLESLLGGNTLSNGDLVFSDFSYKPLTPLTVPAGSIFVNSDTLNTLEFTGSFAVPASSGNVLDAILQFKVTSTLGITGVGLQSTGGTAGTGQVFIAEVVRDGSNGNGVANLANLFNSVITHDQADVSFGALASLIIRKDISLSAGNGVAVLSDFNQTFTTGTGTTEPGTAIPTPAVGLAGMALLGVVMATRRRLP